MGAGLEGEDEICWTGAGLGREMGLSRASQVGSRVEGEIGLAVSLLKVKVVEFGESPCKNCVRIQWVNVTVERNSR